MDQNFDESLFLFSVIILLAAEIILDKSYTATTPVSFVGRMSLKLGYKDSQPTNNTHLFFLILACTGTTVDAKMIFLSR